LFLAAARQTPFKVHFRTDADEVTGTAGIGTKFVSISDKFPPYLQIT
jgi:hypothetical protein